MKSNRLGKAAKSWLIRFILWTADLTERFAEALDEVRAELNKEKEEK